MCPFEIKTFMFTRWLSWVSKGLGHSLIQILYANNVKYFPGFFCQEWTHILMKPMHIFPHQSNTLYSCKCVEELDGFELYWIHGFLKEMWDINKYLSTSCHFFKWCWIKSWSKWRTTRVWCNFACSFCFFNFFICNIVDLFKGFNLLRKSMIFFQFNFNICEPFQESFMIGCDGPIHSCNIRLNNLKTLTHHMCIISWSSSPSITLLCGTKLVLGLEEMKCLVSKEGEICCEWFLIHHFNEFSLS